MHFDAFHRIKQFFTDYILFGCDLTSDMENGWHSGRFSPDWNLARSLVLFRTILKMNLYLNNFETSSVYKSKNSYDQRLLTSKQIRNYGRDIIPVIVEPYPGQQMSFVGKNKEYFKVAVKAGMKVSKLVAVVRKSISFSSAISGLFLLDAFGRVLDLGCLMADLTDCCSDDGILYLFVKKESVFGRDIVRLATQVPTFH